MRQGIESLAIAFLEIGNNQDLRKMKPKSVSIAINRKFNLGNYESVDFNVFASAELEEHESPSEAILILSQECTEAINNAIAFEQNIPKQPFARTTHKSGNIEVTWKKPSLDLEDF